MGRCNVDAVKTRRTSKFMSSEPEYKYVAYIDEAGDDGLTRVRPLDPNGSSEWLIVSAVVVGANREREVVDWVDDIVSGLWRHHARTLHFRKLSENKQLFVVERMADLNARYFVVCSNKKNMKGYTNPFAANIPSKNWFYCWMTRLLLERVTDYVAWRSIKDHGSPQKVKVEYSNRGGLSYSQMNAYYRWLSFKGNNTKLKAGKIHWSAINYDLLKVYPSYERSGLQLADVVASAFFKAADKHNTGKIDASCAKVLAPRMARSTDSAAQPISGYGVKLLPSLRGANLDADQVEIFTHYGYPRQWWAPDSSDPLVV